MRLSVILRRKRLPRPLEALGEGPEGPEEGSCKFWQYGHHPSTAYVGDIDLRRDRCDFSEHGSHGPLASALGAPIAFTKLLLSGPNWLYS